ncbi:hypothetical protein SprV_0100158100 [Sparganum proliferum]
MGVTRFAANRESRGRQRTGFRHVHTRVLNFATLGLVHPASPPLICPVPAVEWFDVRGVENAHRVPVVHNALKPTIPHSVLGKANALSAAIHAQTSATSATVHPALNLSKQSATVDAWMSSPSVEARWRNAIIWKV